MSFLYFRFQLFTVLKNVLANNKHPHKLFFSNPQVIVPILQYWKYVGLICLAVSSIFGYLELNLHFSLNWRELKKLLVWGNFRNSSISLIWRKFCSNLIYLLWNLCVTNYNEDCENFTILTSILLILIYIYILLIILSKLELSCLTFHLQIFMHL